MKKSASDIIKDLLGSVKTVKILTKQLINLLKYLI